MPMITEVIERIRTVLTPAPEPSLPAYDLEYLRECDYKHLEMFVERNGTKCIRCNLCGHYYAPTEIAVALDHVASHANHITDEIDALKQIEDEEVQFDYSDLLQTSDTPDDQVPVAPDQAAGGDADDE
jgi:hypothetical protein